MAIPTRIIEGIYNSELKAQDYYDKYGKEEIEKALEEIKKSNIEILNKYKTEDMKSQILAKMEDEDKEKDLPNKKSFKVLRYISYAAAAVLLGIFILPRGINSLKTKTSMAEASARHGENLREGLFLYHQTSDKEEVLEDGSKVSAGDFINISYCLNENEYLIIFSLDGNGNITRHFPKDSWEAQKRENKRGQTPIYSKDTLYQLNNAPEFECFIMVTSTKAFNLSDIEKRIKDKESLDYIKELDYLPENTKALSFTLVK